MTKQPPTDTGVCGEYRGMQRHRRRGEEPCRPCKDANAKYDRERGQARRAAKSKPPTPCGTPTAYRRGCRCEQCRQATADYRAKLGSRSTQENQAHTQAIIEEIEFFLSIGEGEHAILKALSTTPRTLKRRLHRASRSDLMPRIFQPTPNEYVRRAA